VSIGFSTLLLISTCLAGTALPAAEPSVWIEFLGQPSLTASEFTVSAGALHIPGAKDVTVPLAEVVSISMRRQEPISGEQPTSLIWLSNGDRLAAVPTAVDEETLTCRWVSYPDSEPLRIPLEFVTIIAPALPTARQRRLELLRELALDPQTKDDLAWLISGDRVAGEFTGLEAGEYLMTTNSGPLPIRRDKLLALRFAAELVTAVKPAERREVISLTDGSRITATQFEFNAERLQLTTFWGDECTLPASAFAEMHVASPRIAWLTEQTPERFEHTPYVGGDWPLTTDRNVRHGPLMVRDRECAFGFGVHSQSEIVYKLTLQDREFQAEIGIDDVAEGAGSAVFIVRVDDRDVWSSGEVTGSTPMISIPAIPLDKAKRLTLRVEFGELGDVRDVANWCHPVLLRTP